MTAYKKLEDRFRRLSSLQHLTAIAGWDSAVMMPEGGQKARGEAMAEARKLMTEWLQDPELGELFSKAESEAGLHPWPLANLREMKRIWLESVAVDQNLVAEKSRRGSLCEHAWRSLRKENNWKDFLPLFKSVVELTKEEAQQRAGHTGLTPYDSLIALYEPGQNQERIAQVFSKLRTDLVPLLQKIVERQKSEKVSVPTGEFSVAKQKELGLRVMSHLGFDFRRGRLDESHHPFCGGVSSDVRITSRYVTQEFMMGLWGVIHETGHALYEQGLPLEWMSQPVGMARSMGLHESQSLLYEMQLSRSLEFMEFLAPMGQEMFPSGGGAFWSPQNLFSLMTRVKPGFIRVDADEVTYPFHVILRFEAEQALIGGRLKVEDLPEFWNHKMKEYLGLSTSGNDRDGCMQDIHWTDGSFGYFPSYTLGSLTAAQIFRTLLKEIPGLKDQVRTGEFEPLRQWLGNKIWSMGCFFSTDDLLLHATGERLNPGYFIRHIESRYLS